MKKIIVLAVIVCITLGSCYTYQVEFGDGPQEFVVIETEHNHYFLWGLVPVKEVDIEELTKGEEDCVVTTSHTFLDGILNFLTLGIYTPTTTEVKR